MNLSRKASFWIIAVVYVLATVVGLITYEYLVDQMPIIAALFAADVAATILTWFFGLVFKNVSVYDPYWSVAPPVMLTIYAITLPEVTVAGVAMLAVVMLWAVRLTGNWSVTFKGMQHEDWRYTKYREMLPPVLFHPLNFFGLNMMPTVVVFLAMQPAFRLLDEAVDANIYSWLGAAMCVAATVIQHLADTTAHKFRREHPGQVCRVGLWKHGRHPNYFGEILMWWGIWVQSLVLPIDWTITGAIVNTLLFLCVSIPLMESRQLRNKPDYAAYRKEARMLI